MTTPTSITREKVTADNLLKFSYTIDYTHDPFQVSVTISAPKTDPPNASPPAQATGPRAKTPYTTTFDDGKASFRALSSDGYYIQGTMMIRPLGLENSGDDLGIFCDVSYGYNATRHFMGVSITFQSAL